MPLLGPDLAHRLRADERRPERVRGVGQLEEQALHPVSGRLHVGDAAAAVPGQLVTADGRPHRPVGDGADAAGQQLGPLGALESGDVLRVPLKEGRRQPGHQRAVQRVGRAGHALGQTTLKMPRVEAHHQLRPPAEEFVEPRAAAAGSTAVAVGVEHGGRQLACPAVPVHEAGRQRSQRLTVLGRREDGGEDLSPLVPDRGGPGGGGGGPAGQLLGHLPTEEMPTEILTTGHWKHGWLSASRPRGRAADTR